MESNLTKEQAIKLAKRALKDIGHWENFKIEDGSYWVKDPPYDYNFWQINFKFHENDPFNGKEVPTLIVNDEEGVVTFVSWSRTDFLLSYDTENDKYYHPTLSR
ncbi:hypothetical protein ACIVBQ_001359 [Tenacibaculum discolor]